MIDATAATMTLTIIRNVLFNRAVQFWLSLVCFANGAVLFSCSTVGFSFGSVWFSCASVLVQFGTFVVDMHCIGLKYPVGVSLGEDGNYAS